MSGALRDRVEDPGARNERTRGRLQRHHRAVSDDEHAIRPTAAVFHGSTACEHGADRQAHGRHRKVYNDHYGHIAGDACLQLVARTLRETVRPGSDLVARYGGEEFVMVLPEAGDDGARAAAERARQAVHALNEPHALSQHGVVTISIGAAAFQASRETSVEAQMKRADAALYEAKRNGRNRVAWPSS